MLLRAPSRYFGIGVKQSPVTIKSNDKITEDKGGN